PVTFEDLMVTQAIRIGSAAQTYVPNSAPLNASVDLRKPKLIAWGTSIPQTYVVNENQPQPDNPPNRVVQYLNNAGFMVGFLPDVGVGAELNTHTSRTFEIRNTTGKIYAHALESTRIGNLDPSGEAYTTAMYRVFCDLSKVRTAQRLSYFM